MSIQLNLSPLSSYIPHQHPLIISGPCSVETEAQVHAAAAGLAALGKASVLRGGIWKPRTRPNAFEGIGNVGLKWLVDAAKQHNFLSATEVANAAHVEAALKAGVDILWIGARTTVNPFSVQEIADAVKGQDVPVWVKNPLNPDLQLWIGALERIAQAGITKIAAIHRGFAPNGPSQYRNPPKWDLAIELKRQIPNLEMICDPSHISGNRELLLPVAQKALDLEMSGLMLETHCTPDEAWSDAKQQITPEKFGELLDKLVIRKVEVDAKSLSELEEIRKQIDLVDEDIIEKIASRMKLVEQIAEYKAQHNITILQMDRWKHVIDRWNAEGARFGLAEDFISNVLQAVHKESIRKQTGRMNKREE
ncbi:MAG: chorismate mutase [Bacteroidota bacterium]